MFLKALCPTLLLLSPTTLFAAETHEIVRAPAGKTVMAWREVKPRQNASITCPPDSTKAFWCGARKAELAAQADAARPERLTER